MTEYSRSFDLGGYNSGPCWFMDFSHPVSEKWGDKLCPHAKDLKFVQEVRKGKPWGNPYFTGTLPVAVITPSDDNNTTLLCLDCLLEALRDDESLASVYQHRMGVIFGEVPPGFGPQQEEQE